MKAFFVSGAQNNKRLFWGYESCIACTVSNHNAKKPVFNVTAAKPYSFWSLSSNEKGSDCQRFHHRGTVIVCPASHHETNHRPLPRVWAIKLKLIRLVWANGQWFHTWKPCELNSFFKQLKSTPLFDWSPVCWTTTVDGRRNKFWRHHTNKRGKCGAINECSL